METDTIVLIVTIIGSVLGSTLTTISLLVNQMNRLENGVDGRLNVISRDLADARERLARIEGYLMSPEAFYTRGAHPPAADEAPSADPVG